MSERKIGVYVCHCGGNISDYVDVDEVIKAVESEPGVKVAHTAMFTCSDATQQEIVNDIQEQGLDGIVVASCSPKLHTFTFREVAKRAGLNPYQYTQVNLREQCSWAHTDDKTGATDKAIRLVRGGIARTLLTEPLEPIVVDTVPKVVVIGGGVTGLRSALGLAGIGLSVFLVEREEELGGWVGGFREMYPQGKNGRALIDDLVHGVSQHPNVTVFKNAEVVSKTGSFGNYTVGIQVQGDSGAEIVEVEAGSLVVATGFQSYLPAEGEFGYGLDGVLTLPEFKSLVEQSEGPLIHDGRPVNNVAYIYCVGSRQPEGNTYCSRYCCTAAIHASLQAAAKSGYQASGTATHETAATGRVAPADPGRVPSLHQYHLYRDIRSYGKYELLYNESRAQGSVYLRFPDDEPPVVQRASDGQGLTVTTRDQLTGGVELTIPVDLVVLVTGMVPRENEELIKTLKLPVGNDGFFNEIHPKLRPVETVVDGVFICGACQSPKNSAEAVTSGLAAVTQSAAILKRGYAELDPLVAVVDADACEWCGKCLEACPYGAPGESEVDGKAVAVIDKTACKGCGGCVPVCPKNAIDLQGYTDAQVKAMIEAFMQELTPCQP